MWVLGELGYVKGGQMGLGGEVSIFMYTHTHTNTHIYIYTNTYI